MFQLFRAKQLKNVTRNGSYCTKKDGVKDTASQAEFLSVLKQMMTSKQNPVADSKPSEPGFSKLFDVDTNKEPLTKPKSNFFDSKHFATDTATKSDTLFGSESAVKNEEGILSFLNNIVSSPPEKSQSDGLGFVSDIEREPKRRWKPVSQLEYFPVYPKQIKKWVTFTRTPRGFYDLNGRWVVLGEFDVPDSGLEKYEAETSRKKMEKIFEEEQAKLPDHLRGRFRFGVQYDEIKDLGPKVKRLFSFSSATDKEIRKEQKLQAIIKWRKHENDTASDAIQVDILTQRIESLIGHLQKNKQDKRNLRSLQLLVKKRRGLMRYLKKRDVHLYFCVLREAKLKDLYNVYNYHVK